jgi:Mrp family chromosome partitioning ATPase
MRSMETQETGWFQDDCRPDQSAGANENSTQACSRAICALGKGRWTRQRIATADLTADASLVAILTQGDARADIFALTIAKGGCGKTTVALNLAVCFAGAGNGTLAIDLNQQGNLSAGLGSISTF